MNNQWSQLTEPSAAYKSNITDRLFVDKWFDVAIVSHMTDGSLTHIALIDKRTWLQQDETSRNRITEEKSNNSANMSSCTQNIQYVCTR